MAAWIAAVASVELSSRAPNALTLKILSVFFESTLKFPAFHVAVSGRLPSALTSPAVLTAPPFAAMSARTSLAVIPIRESAWNVSYWAGPRRARDGRFGRGIMDPGRTRRVLPCPRTRSHNSAGFRSTVPQDRSTQGGPLPDYPPAPVLAPRGRSAPYKPPRLPSPPPYRPRFRARRTFRVPLPPT